MPPMMVGIVLFGLVGVLLVALGLPLLRRRVRPNSLYGLRSRETRADEGVWYEANALLGRGQVALGTSLLVLAWGLPLLPGLSAGAHVLCCLAWLVAGVLALCIGSQAAARRMAAERAGGSPDRAASTAGAVARTPRA